MHFLSLPHHMPRGEQPLLKTLTAPLHCSAVGVNGSHLESIHFLLVNTISAIHINMHIYAFLLKNKQVQLYRQQV